MAAVCGIHNIKIGKKEVSSLDVVDALNSVKEVQDLDRAIAKSYEQMPKGTDFDAWNKWFRNFEEGSPTGEITGSEIAQRDRAGSYAERLAKLLNLAEHQDGKQEVGQYAKRIFNKVKENLLSRGKGLTDDEIASMMTSLKSVLTKDKIHQDQRALRKQAKINLPSKIGAIEGLSEPMNKLLSIEPNLVPPEKVDLYNKILTEFGQRTRVLVLKDAGETFTDIQEFLQGLPEALFVKKEKKAKVELEPDTLIKQIRNKVIDSSKIKNEHERKDVRELEALTDADLEGLSATALQTIVDSIDAINGGIFPPALSDVLTDVKVNRELGDVTNIQKAIPKGNWTNWFSRLFGGIKAKIRKQGTNFATEIIRSNPLTVVDQMFGGKGKQIYNATFGKLSSAYSSYQVEVKGINNKLDAAEDALGKKFKGNALAKAKFLIKIFQVQREFEANQSKDGVAPAIDWLNKTLEDSDNLDFYSKDSKRLLREIIEEHAVDGQFSVEALEKKLGKEMKDSIKVMDEINNSLLDKLLYVSGTIRGKQASLYELYTSHNVLSSNADHDSNLSERKKNFFSVSAKSGATQERTGQISAISFDPFYDIAQSTRGLLLDFHMTPVNKEVLRTTKRALEANKNESELVQQGARALNSTVKEVLENVFSANTMEYTSGDKFIEDVKRLGYYATLASAPRAVSELVSNVSFAVLAAPKQFALGAGKYRKEAYDPSGAVFMNNVGSTQTNKSYESGVQGSKHVDAPTGGFKSKRAEGVSELENSIQNKKDIILKYSGLKFAANKFSKTAEFLISTPDKIVNRTLWYGAFGDAFTKAAGFDPDMAKIKEGDVAYLEKNKDAIKKARESADQLSTMSGATNNPFSSIISLQQKKHKSGASNVYRLLSGYLQRFLIFEYSTAKTAVLGLMGEGHLTRRQGLGVMAGVTARMTFYGVVYAFLSDALAEGLGFEDEEEDEEDWGKMLRNDLLGSILTLFFGRTLTSFPKIPINFAIEQVNKNIVGEENYKYEDKLVYDQLGSGDFGYRKNFYTFLGKLMGPYSPAAKGIDTVWKEIGKSVKGDQELTTTAKNSLFQILGNAGLIPFFKDVNKIYKEEQYKASKKKKKRKGKKKGFDLGIEKIDLDLGVDDIDIGI